MCEVSNNTCRLYAINEPALVSGGSETKRQPFSSIIAEKFFSLKRLFQSPAAPLSTKTKVDLTNIYVPKDKNKVEIDIEKAVHTIVQGKDNWNFKKVALFSLLASCVGYQFFESHRASTPKVGPTIGGDLDIFGSATKMRRVLLSSSASPSSNYSINATEEIAFSQSFNTWDVFPFPSLGRLVVSTTSPLPLGVKLVQSQMKILNSIAISQYSRFAASDNALYVTKTGSSTVQVINTEDILKPSLTKIIKTGDVPIDIHVIGNNLYIAGNDTIIKIFDISPPFTFSPIERGKISISGIGATRITSTGMDEQFGCIAQSSFFCINASNSSNPISTGNVNVSGTARVIAASPGYYYIGSTTGLSIVNTTQSSSPTLCSFLPLPSIIDLKYSNDFCYATTNTGLSVIDVRDPSNPLLVNNIVYPAELLLGLLQPFENVMYYISSLGMGILDLTNQTNPQILASALFPGANIANTFRGDSLIFGSGNNINFATRRDSFSFSGIPKGGSQGVYRPLLTATTLNGQVINDTQAFELNILPAVTPALPIGELIAVVGRVFNAIIDPNTFQTIGIPLRYSLECESESTLTSSVFLNPVSAQFYGTPTENDVGSTTCAITARDARDNYGASGLSSSFNITVVYGPKVTIQNQIATIGQPFSLNLTATSKDSSSQFTFTVSNLPPSFTLNNDTISGTPVTIGTYTTSVTATDQNGISDTKSFIFNVATPGVPVFLNPLSSQTVSVGNEFSIAIPLGAAVDPSNPNAAITYSASLLGGRPFPSWMHFDGTRLHGTPPASEIVFDDVTYNVALTATERLSNGGQTTASTVFSIIVTGTSLFRSTIAWLVPTLTIVGALLAKRVSIYNSYAGGCITSCGNKLNHIFCCCFDKEIEFFRSEEVLVPRQSLEYTFKTRRSEIASFKAFYGPRQDMPSLIYPYPDGLIPDWLNLHYDGDKKTWKISTEYVSDLDLGGINAIKIFAVTKKGYHLEEVTFTKTTSDDQNFSRRCNTPSEEIEKIKFIFGTDRTPGPRPSWLKYNRAYNKIIVKDAPPQKEIGPLTIFIFDQSDKILETIYINNSSKEKQIILATEGSLLEERTPLLANSTGESKSSSSIELTEHKGGDLSAAPHLLINDKGARSGYDKLVS